MIKAGILGGGQLGRMLLQEAANYPVEVSVMEKDPSCPSAKLCHHFILGDITNYDDVIRFGEGLDVITIEIENVNVEALFELEKRGCRIIPKPQALRTIKNKILQKEFYTEHQIPTASYKVLQNREELKNNIDFLPAVHKLATGGYDGKGVQIIKKQEDIPLGFDAPAVLEKMISIEKEIAIIVAVAENGKTAIYPPVEMFFDPVLNLLDLQLCPASIPEKTMWKAEAIALTVARKLDSPGIFAIEMFVDREGNVWVNETAPRVHNSGHHTIEAHYSSQFDMLWRIILNYPLGNTAMIMSSMMVNLLGAEGYAGKTEYEGLEEILSIPDVFVHLYGKTDTKPGRKMGHATIISNEKQELIHQANKIKSTLRIKGDKQL
ncbi:MAG: 5-(carboxyamino)imidazole ribonucleotide synthase [Chitinophagaceae bacterium]|nr:5-(carboxyamino)imidazole ribonucleotide synthase [Chitinophagaceae bacterium]